MKRILYITSRADYGGGPEHLRMLINGLKDKYLIFVACPKEEPYWSYYEHVVGNKRMVELPHRKFTIYAFLQLVNWVSIHKIDLIHSHGKGAGLYSRLLKFFFPTKKVIHTLHGLHYRQYSRVKLFLYLKLEKILSHCTSVIINVSNGELSEAKKLNLYPENRACVIYNGVDLNFYITNTSSLNLTLVEKLKRDFVIVNISRFDYQKNVNLIIEIAIKLINCEDDITILLIGDGPDRKDIEEKVNKLGLKNILFLGFQNNVLPFLKLANVYLSTSRWEGLPIALLESLAIGIPIIATDVVGNNEVVLHEKNGYLFPLHRPDLCCKYILTLKGNPEILKKMSDMAIKQYMEKFTAEMMLVKTDKIYNQVLKSSN
jgi:glycosyltransferase involved in cell wall biosynthesis